MFTANLDSCVRFVCLTAMHERPHGAHVNCHLCYLIASFFSLFPVHPVSGTRPTCSLSLSLPLLYHHCLHSVLTASTQTPIHTDMYINSPHHSGGQPTDNQKFQRFVPSCSPFSLSLSTFKFPLGRRHSYHNHHTHTSHLRPPKPVLYARVAFTNHHSYHSSTS